ncbi:MAG: hypothetical protein HY897_20390 [Deltaproteobacteria bacterium]|nr:hypothetical protein [Deltaproteobacteria bacterium]
MSNIVFLPVSIAEDRLSYALSRRALAADCAFLAEIQLPAYLTVLSLSAGFRISKNDDGVALPTRSVSPPRLVVQ